MPTETFQVNPRSLSHLLSSVHERQLALPDFQRDFVWDPRMTEELIESIACAFPAGSLLFMPFRPKTFAPRAVENAPDLAGGKPAELILDGQQRLTSLYQAFYGQGDHLYFIDLHALLDGEEIEDAVFFRHRNRSGRYATPGKQAAELVLPLGTLFGAAGGFHGWRDTILDLRPEEGDDRIALRDRLREIHDLHIKTIEDYRFPVVSLAHDTSLEAVCSIFETLNRTGVRLSVFELLAARFYAQQLDLRRKLHETLSERPIISEFEIDEYYLLQAVSLRARGSVKRGDVLNLSVANIHEHWDPVARGCEAALRMLRDECGVLTGRWLPYAYFLVPMSAVWEEAIAIAGPAAGANRERLKRWFWCSGFSQTYDRAANTRAAADYSDLRRWFAVGDVPATVSGFAFDIDRLAEITPRQQSVYKALMALILRRPALDFHHASRLTGDSVKATGADDHHIFPSAYLNPPNGVATQPTELVDSILNRTMIDADTNRRIGKRAPSDYLQEVRTELDLAAADAFRRVLASHILPSDDDSPLMRDDFTAFVEWRRERFRSEMSAATQTEVEQASDQ